MLGKAFQGSIIFCIAILWVSCGGSSTNPGISDAYISDDDGTGDIISTGDTDTQTDANTDDVVCINETLRLSSTSCGLNSRGVYLEVCNSNAWTLTTTCQDDDVCLDNTAKASTTPCVSNENLVFEVLCVTGQWKIQENCIEPDNCTENAIRPSSLTCGLNNRGFYQEKCITSSWQITNTCIDPDVCIDTYTQSGITSCGFNGRGVYQQVCTTGHWINTTTCLDTDSCTDTDSQIGESTCGFNGRGVLEQICATGHWVDTTICHDKDACTDDDVQVGITACGLNNRGLLEQNCITGQWQDNSICHDPDDCVDEATTPGTTACGLNNRGVYESECQAGQWQETTECLDPDKCIDNDIQNGTTPCGIFDGGSLEKKCIIGTWENTETCHDNVHYEFLVDTDPASGESGDGSLEYIIEFKGTFYFSTYEGIWATNGTYEGTQKIIIDDPDPCTGFRALAATSQKLFVECNNEVYTSSTPMQGDFIHTVDSPITLIKQSTKTEKTVYAVLMHESDDSLHSIVEYDGSYGRTELHRNNRCPPFDSVNTIFEIGDLLFAEVEPASSLSVNDALWIYSSDSNCFEPIEVGIDFLLFNDDDENHLYANYNNKLLFRAHEGFDNDFDTEPWISDGTQSGTYKIKDINPFGNSNPEYFAVHSDKVYFSANDGIHGQELWITDGTEANTRLVKDINLSGDSYPRYTFIHEELLFFNADDGVHGFQLWVSDGTADGTSLFFKFNNENLDATPRDFTCYNGTCFIQARGDMLWQLWYTHDIFNGFYQVSPFYKVSSFTPLDDYLLFFADGQNGYGAEPWTLWP